MESSKIREEFLKFFQTKTHEIVSSAPMVIKDDPTLMFTNAGMNQFKDIFLGNSEPKHSRVANSQKCLRVSGKHNDLEEVGVDTYHHTMFEMLGNWSFGDYFKQEAIDWAWELLTEVYGISKDDLYITIFEGDRNDGLGPDTEARDFWLKHVPEDRILEFDKKDNFWEMGETGPCGPCSEIHIDIRTNEEKTSVPGKDLVNKDHPHVVEIWNLVFMEFNRDSKGALSPLPSKHIDTGMGFERLAMVLQGKNSNYDTDVFSPLIGEIEMATGLVYKRTDDMRDVAMRVIADHVRAVSFSIADGQLPSNTGAGYVIRRILRRAVRYAYSFLNKEEPFIHSLVEVLVAQMGSHFPELAEQKVLISKVIKEEEENFLRTLEKGISRLNELLESSDGKVLPGKSVFELYDTYGFPVDLTSLIASESGVEVDDKGFQEELEQQKNRSRAAGKIQVGDWVVLKEDAIEEFIGYDSLQAEIFITQYREVESKGKKLFQLVFNLTPFYPEGGGQVGDVGYIESKNEKIDIINTVKENNQIIHLSAKLPSSPETPFSAVVNGERRKTTMLNHTATHLLHEALRSVLGTHVEQKGSLVHPDYLRFDFSHFAKVTDDELTRIESMVNRKIQENLALEESRNIPLNQAKNMGAMMLFGEKYGDVVRVIKFGESIELCGGTHVPATGNIGLFKITHETAVAAGIRRVEAVSGEAARQYFNQHLNELSEIRSVLKNPKDVLKAVEDLLDKQSALQKELEQFSREKTKGIKSGILDKASDVNGVKFLAERIDLGPSEVKDLAFQLKSENSDLFAVFGSENDGKALLTIVISDQIVQERDLNAGQIIRELAKEIQGGGGGQAFFATAGGKNIDGLDKALKNAINYLS